MSTNILEVENTRYYVNVSIAWTKIEYGIKARIFQTNLK